MRHVCLVRSDGPSQGQNSPLDDLQDTSHSLYMKSKWKEKIKKKKNLKKKQKQQQQNTAARTWTRIFS